jgi:hypothetical protein
VAHERRVSEYLGAMTVLWLAVPGEPSPQSMRAIIERNVIALLSNGMRPHDPPSDGWLGRYSRKPEIRQSGLWNVNHVSEAYNPAFLLDLESLVGEMLARVGAGDRRVLTGARRYRGCAHRLSTAPRRTCDRLAPRAVEQVR